MDRIEVKLLDCTDGTKAPFLARLTQRGHQLKTMDDVINLVGNSLPGKVSDGLKESLATLPHGTIKRFDIYSVIAVGASRRFLAQVRTHQHADFVSGSLQYSDWSKEDPAEMFVVPYEIISSGKGKEEYLQSCLHSFNTYQTLVSEAGNDAAGFVLPNGTRNVLIIQANAQQWQYMIGCRTCRRNSAETRYVMYRIWEELYRQDPIMFSIKAAGTFCQMGNCREGRFACGEPVIWDSPSDCIKNEFPELYKEVTK